MTEFTIFLVAFKENTSQLLEVTFRTLPYAPSSDNTAAYFFKASKRTSAASNHWAQGRLKASFK